jgi:hypothetical protein
MKKRTGTTGSKGALSTTIATIVLIATVRVENLVFLP